MVLPELIGRGRRAHPDRAALVFGDEARTHAGLHERAARLATVLEAEGVGRGDRVALLLHNGFEFVESLLAIHLLGAVAVPINFRLTADEIAYILRDSGAVALIEGRLPRGTRRAARAARRSRQTPLAEDDPALMCYTSGTTGRPKGAVLTHGNLVASTESWISEMRAGPEDVWLSGHAALPHRRHQRPAAVPRARRHQRRHAHDRASTPRRDRAHRAPRRDRCASSSRRSGTRSARATRCSGWTASACASRCGPRRRRRARRSSAWAARSPSAAIVSAYGQTEMSGATTLLKGAGRHAQDGLGRQADARRRAAGRRRASCATSPTGEVGEVVYRGPTVMAGYHGNREATAEAFAGGWFHSGDLARRRRRGLPLARRPQEGPDHQRRRERLPGRGRARAARAPGRGRRRRGRRPASRAGSRRRSRSWCHAGGAVIDGAS